MYIYKAERDAGLADQLRKPLAIAARASAAQKSDLPAGNVDLKAPRACASVQDADLFWFKSLMVSTGWNDNEMFFDKAELWPARHTPEDKPVNVDHVQHDILGHMVGCYAVGADKSTVVADDTAPDELPDEIHLMTPGVLYAKWEDKALQTRADKIIGEVKDGTRSVSMEVWYKSFDYVLEAADGARRVVARTKDTAHLTKSLRVFGGTGKVDNERVGMLLRGLLFAGKGLVTDPANPHSEVVETGTAPAAAEKISPAVAAEVERPAAAGYVNETQKGNIMADAPAAVKTDETDWKAKASEQVAFIATLQSQLAEATTALKAQAEVVKSKDDAIKAKDDELAAIKVATQKADRLDRIHTDLGIAKDEAGKAKAAEFLKPLATLSDENFAAALKNQVELIAAAKPAAPPAAKLAEVAPNKADAATLETAVVEAKVELAVATKPADHDEVLKAVANRYRTKKKGN